MTSSTTALNQDISQLLNLLLGTAQGAQTLLGELACTLVLVVLQEFHAALLVGGEAGDLTDKVTDELDTLAKSLLKAVSIKLIRLGRISSFTSSLRTKYTSIRRSVREERKEGHAQNNFILLSCRKAWV